MAQSATSKSQRQRRGAWGLYAAAPEPAAPREDVRRVVAVGGAVEGALPSADIEGAELRQTRVRVGL